MMKRSIPLLLLLSCLLLPLSPTWAKVRVFQKEMKEPLKDEQNRKYIELLAILKGEQAIRKEMKDALSPLPTIRFWKLTETQISALLTVLGQVRHVGFPLLEKKEGTDLKEIKVQLIGELEDSAMEDRLLLLFRDLKRFSRLVELHNQKNRLLLDTKEIRDPNVGQVNRLYLQYVTLRIEGEKIRGAFLQEEMQNYSQQNQLSLEQLKEGQESYDVVMDLYQNASSESIRVNPFVFGNEETLEEFNINETAFWEKIEREARLNRIQWSPVEQLKEPQIANEIQWLRDEIEKLTQDLKRHYLIRKRKMDFLYNRLISRSKETGPEKSTDDENSVLKGVLPAGGGEQDNFQRLRKEFLKQYEVQVIDFFQIQNMQNRYKLLEPYILRLKKLQKRQFPAFTGKLEITLGSPDQKVQRFPITFTYTDKKDFSKKSYTRHWYYGSVEKAREIYKKRDTLIPLEYYQYQFRRVMIKAPELPCPNYYQVLPGELEIRKSASENSAVVGNFQLGDKICIQSQKKHWMKTRQGWIKEKCPEYSLIIPETLNIRDKPSSQGKKQGFYNQGRVVCVLDKKPNWSKTDRGWVFGKYVETIKDQGSFPKNVKKIQKDPDQVTFGVAPSLTKVELFHLDSEQSQGFRMDPEGKFEEVQQWEKLYASIWGIRPDTFSNSLGMLFRKILPGKFLLGSETGEYDELPMQEKFFSSGFYLLENELTLARYKQFKPDHQNQHCLIELCPANQISWEGAQEFIRWLNEKKPEGEKGLYRLPTEAEWEYSAKAGQQQDYSFGKDTIVLSNYAWYVENANFQSHPVKEKFPNSWGLFDMHGNLQEWVEDWYKEYHFEDDNAPPSIPPPGKVARGGSWGHEGDYLRSSSRNYADPKEKFSNTGFRILYELQE